MANLIINSIMVLAFVVGLVVGLPVGCYLREMGYAGKVKKAYQVFSPLSNERKIVKYENKTKEFYDSIAKGDADHKDFERYIYGGSYNKRNNDDRDDIETQIRIDIDKNFKV